MPSHVRRRYAAAFVATIMAANANAQHDFVEDEIPCAVRCALAAASLIAPDGRVPDVDEDTLRALREPGDDLRIVFRFLRRHGFSPAWHTGARLTELRPSGQEPVMLEMNADWPKRGASEDGLAGVDYGDETAHYVLAIGREGTALLIWDVTVGDELIAIVELEPYFTGRIVTLKPQPAWMRAVREMAARNDIRLGAAGVLLLGGVLLAVQYRRSKRQRLKATE